MRSIRHALLASLALGACRCSAVEVVSAQGSKHDDGLSARLEALGAELAELKAAAADHQDTRRALEATRAELRETVELLRALAVQVSDLTVGSQAQQAVAPFSSEQHRALQGSSPSSTYNSTTITKDRVESCNFVAHCDLIVKGNIFYKGGTVRGPRSPTPVPTPLPTRQFNGDCSAAGVYSRFEKGGKCPLVHYDMSTMEAGRVKDLIGGNNLNIVGTPLANVQGVVGSAYRIRTAGDYFLSMSGYPVVLRGSSLKSMSLWALSDNGAGDGDGTTVFASFGGACAGGAFAVGCQPSGVRFYTWCNDIGSSPCTDFGMWHHYVIVFDGSLGKVYQDGAQVFSGAFPYAVNTDTVFDKIAVGADTGWSASSHFLGSGIVDEVKIYGYALSPGEVQSLYQVKTPGACSAAGVYAAFEKGGKCPLVHYDMSTMEAGRVKDLIGGNNLNIAGTPLAGQPGKVGTAYRIRASSDYFMSVGGYPAQLRGGSSKSMALWANLDNGAGNGDSTTVFASFGGACTGGAFAMGCQPSGVRFYTWCNDIGTSSCTDYGNWHHYVIVYTGLTGYIYVDGVLAFSSGFPSPVNTNTVMDRISVGVDTGHGGTVHHLGHGLVDEVKIFGYALSAVEVAALFALHD